MAAADQDQRYPLRDVVIVLALLISIVGAFWTIIQTQFSAAKEREEVFQRAIDARITGNVQNAKDLLTYLQAQIDRREADGLRRDEQSIKRSDVIQAELDRRRSEFVTTREFIEFEKLVSAFRDQIKVLETTRPTTGELQAIGNGNRDQITKLEERVRSLEDNLRRIVVPKKTE